MADGNVFEPFALEEDSKYTVIAAARREKAVYDPDLGNSVFTYFLVEGLEIQGDYARSDAMVTGMYPLTRYMVMSATR